jgi:putative transcription factor|uniref:HTH cro/C1-type domain-containing protein n=1 Tax=viral metagenome TaxID=1070528 RepID=A0A6C0H3A5_9ZZZZ
MSKDQKRKHNPEGTKEFRELDSNDPPPPKQIEKSICILMQQARLAKGLTQKDLAKGLNIQTCVITEYESGKVIPNHQLVRRIGGFLGVKLL